MLVLLTTGSTLAQWPQWGGPARDFDLGVRALGMKWPASGPKLLWSRPLGEGESSIVVNEGMLYTMYRREGKEVTIALNPESGETAWQYSYPAPIPDSFLIANGDGPHATPLATDQRLYTLGITGKLQCLNRWTGKPIWEHDLIEEYGGKPGVCGYGGSPMAYRDTLIVPVGGVGHAVMAFDLSDGAIVWKSQDFNAAGYASPILANVAGEEQLIVFMSQEVAGLNPDNGSLKWSHPHKTDYGVNASMPVWGDDQILFITSAYNNGSRGLRLSQQGSKTIVEELWYQKKMQVHFSNVVRIDDHLYGTSGDFGPVFLVAIHVELGRIAWKKRDIVGKASILRSGNTLLMVDEKGKLVLATVSPQGVTVQAEHQLVDGRIWAAPTLVGTKLYLRDRKNVYAFDLR